MSLPKHLRPRYRYLAIAAESWPDHTINRRRFQDAVWAASRGLHGDAGSARTDPVVIRFALSAGVGHGIVRVRRSETMNARAAIASIDEIDGVPIGLVVLGVSGTIRGCEEKYLGERREPDSERTVVFRNATREAVVRDGLVDVRIGDAFAGATDLDLQEL